MTDHTWNRRARSIHRAKTIRKGYSTDDNARALIVRDSAGKIEKQYSAEFVGARARYLAFLWLAFDPMTKRFRKLPQAMNAVAERKARKTVMAAPCGDRNRPRPSKIRGCVELRVVSSSLRFPCR